MTNPAKSRDLCCAAAMADATFENLCDWLSDHKGEEVHVEFGTSGPDATDPAQAIAAVFVTTLGGLEPASDTGHPPTA